MNPALAANIITLLRIPFAATMLFAQPFSAFFWICYLTAGLSDILDGIVARKLKQESDFGAKIDSIADLVFAGAIAVVIIVNIEFPVWLWISGACIALLRFLSYGVGYIKYRTFSALHTYANRAAGGMIFIFPLYYRLLGVEASGSLLCIVALLSVLEELLITVRSDKLNRERRSIFHQ